MLLKGFGEVLTSVMTVNPALGDLPSASSILDTSNYTFQAVTLGKDAEGFTQHAHVVSSTQYVDGVLASGASSYDSGTFLVLNYGSTLDGGASSYVTSATYLQFLETYKSVPNDPSPLDTRLERGSTLSTQLLDYQYASALPNLGHYANPAIDSQLSAIWNKVGGFGPSSLENYHFYSSTGHASSFVFSGQIQSFFNTNAIMDKDGYLTVNPKAVVNPTQIATESTDGAVLVSSLTTPVSSAKVGVSVTVSAGDACTVAAFGGIKHVGVYCLDLDDMLSSGLLPPYSWDALNNTRKYKLVAKITTLDDPLFHRDFTALTLSGFQKILNENTGSAFTYGGPNITLNFDFK
mgnify:CR=1 FL=1|tara:strand:- start:10884 stop:11930 length:1047 start_codon:yes stop_codon:yes gene_type:complete